MLIILALILVDALSDVVDVPYWAYIILVIALIFQEGLESRNS